MGPDVGSLYKAEMTMTKPGVQLNINISSLILDRKESGSFQSYSRSVRSRVLVNALCRVKVRIFIAK